MRVLVVGGAGYVGGAVTDLLLGTRHEVRVFDALLYEEAYRKPLDFVYGDVRDRASLAPHLAWADAVVWLAALVGDGACALHPDVSFEINRNAVEWLASHFDGRIIFTSTCSVYGAQDALLDENSATDPLSVYALTKLQAEQLLHGSNAIVFRLGTLFGVGDVFSRLRLDLVVNILTLKACTTGRISVFGGNQYRPLLHVRDTAAAILANLETDHVGVFNLHVRNVRISDLADDLLAHFPELEIERTDAHFQDTRNYRVSSERAKAAFGFEPRLTVHDGIEEIKALVLSQRLKDVDNIRYRNHAYLSQHHAHILDVASLPA